jgi:hypothetical protein
MHLYTRAREREERDTDRHTEGVVETKTEEYAWMRER